MTPTTRRVVLGALYTYRDALNSLYSMHLIDAGMSQESHSKALIEINLAIREVNTDD